MKILKTITSFLLILLLASVQLQAGVWEFQPEIPLYDPLWNEVTTLWNNHWDQENIDDLILTLRKIEKKYPDKIDPLLWLAKMYSMKASYGEKEEKNASLLKALKYAKKAYLIDNKNDFAFKILVTCLPNFTDIKNAIKQYGDWINKSSPLITERTIPELKSTSEWEKAMKAWDNRDDINQANIAINIFKNIANKEPDNGFAYVWITRGMYYLGYYYMSIENEEKSVMYFNIGSEYGEKAIKILPNNVPARYWYSLNFGRKMQNRSIFFKAINFKPLLNHTIFCYKENPIYNFYGPLLIIGTTITKGGWIVKKMMNVYGLTIENVLNALDMVEILFPNYLYIPYCRAEILAHIDREDEAKKQLKRILKRNPKASKLHSAENQICIRLSKILLKQIEE